VDVTSRTRFSCEPREPEVKDLDCTLARHFDVGRLQITMDDATLVGRVERAGKLLCNVERLINGNACAFRARPRGA
jgi:hypothetical protein